MLNCNKMILEIILLFGCFILYDCYKRWSITDTLKNIPIVSKIPLIGSLLVLSTMTPDNFHIKWPQFVKRFGKTFYALVMGRIVVVTVDHALVDNLLSSHLHLNKHFVYGFLRDWLGRGLLLNSGKHWQQMRKIITPTFHFKILEQFVQIFDRQTNVFIQKLKFYADGQQIVNVYDLVGLLTLDIIAEAAMGVSINAQLNAASEFTKSIKVVTDIVSNSFVRIHLAIPTLRRLTAPRTHRMRQDGIRVMHDFTAQIIKERQEYLNSKPDVCNNVKEPLVELGIKDRPNFLDVLLQASANGERLTEQQIRDEVNTFMFEGHDTTSSAISFCLYALARHYPVQQKLYAEISTHLSEDLQQPITFSDLQNLEYLNCCIKESLRLYPPIMAIGRALTEELKFDGSVIPKGSNIIILLWEMLRDPSLFSEPCSFQPERHLRDNGKVPAYAFIPFSAGPRNCIGQRFALYEMRTVIVKVLQHFELLPLGADVQPTMKLILRSKTGVNIGLRPRTKEQLL